MKNSSLYLVIPFPLFLSAHFLCALFCLPLFSHHLSSGLFFALPIKNATLFMSPLSFSLPPLLLFPSKRGMEALFLFLFQWMGEWAELAPCPYTLPMLQQTPPLALSPLFFFLVPKRKTKTGSFICSLSFLLFFYFTGKRTREEEDKNER